MKSDEFNSLGEFLVAIVRDGMGLGGDPRLAATAGSDEAHGDSQQYGGFAVPVEFLPRIFRLPQDDTIIGLCTRVPMTSSRGTIPARVDKNHSSSVTGGITVTRRPQTLEIDASRLAMEQIGLEAVSLAGLCYLSEELVTDSRGLAEVYVSTSFEDAVIDALTDETIRGSGVGEFMGILNSPALITIDKEGGQSADTINATNIVKMALQTWNFNQAVWLSNEDTRTQLIGAHVTGTNSDRFLYESPSSDGELPRLLGRPLYFTEHCSTLGDVGDLICFTPSEYVIGDRSRDLSDSMHVRYENAERAIRFTMRNDGQPWWRSTLTPANGANELSPYVVLAERA